MSAELCEYNPIARRAAFTHERHAQAAFSLGHGRWHLCRSCARLPEFERFTRRVALQDGLEANWAGTCLVELRHAICGDWPMPLARMADLIAGRGLHDGWSNQHGALSVRTPGGLLGAKPAEVARWRYVDSPVWWIWSDQTGWIEESPSIMRT